MRKRVAMAASLIHHPELFLMDEPFEGVDAVGARLMKDILLDQVRQGATIFLTSHVLEVVERLCDRVAIINQGRIVTEGRMEDTPRRFGDARRCFCSDGRGGSGIWQARMADRSAAWHLRLNRGSRREEIEMLRVTLP